MNTCYNGNIGKKYLANCGDSPCTVRVIVCLCACMCVYARVYVCVYMYVRTVDWFFNVINFSYNKFLGENF